MWTEEIYYENCDKCDSCLPESDLLYDDYADKYFCDDDCFYEWASDNFETVSIYYGERNLGL